MGVEIQVGGQWKEAADRTPVGAINAFGGTVAPDGWFMCDGSAKSRTTYADLYAVIGTNFGAGDGSTTFNVPNLQGVSLTGVGTQSLSGRAKTGPSLGAAREDQVRGHWHQLYEDVFGAAGGASGVLANSGVGTVAYRIKEPISDGVNGAPRTGAYTHGPEVGVNFIIKH